ncbi:acetylornithine deacetylase/succinyl-diaminopimelate desuccinylase-like protein [Conyzicola lurida]|uniref:Acetylornithine deacetylase/succinyl-diaminopimelate desuccinylase-like protein n=1 Tax=Conyzicola lurida TaxID=1172621 RepID=A0A841AGT7_9MICO|nr:M20/M25/M40 family metallo-hydrolase [Conyzicola lurida]MBB5842427.1 acetylornithine deacetylase/succinyl-diaminopimelate desuccinylase-like protein [Conyzicola lurida]
MESTLSRITRSSLADQTTELLQALIQNRCVNDGTPDSGHEIRTVRTLQEFFEGSGLDGVVVEPHPGRASLIIRIPGTDPAAPSLALVGHTDVVPVEASGWERDPFAGEIVDGVLWGRGAIDMLNLTAAYAVVTRAIARGAEGVAPFRPRGDLIFAAVADEESGSTFGVEWLTDNRLDLIDADYVLTESGGAPAGNQPGIGVMIGEKGVAGRTLRVKGTPGHGSAPWGSRNAGVIAAEAVRRLSRFQTPTVISPQWRRYVAGLDLDEVVSGQLVDPHQIFEALPKIGKLGNFAHASTHTTISPNVIRAGEKLNVIPGEATVDLDIRVLPGVTSDDVDGYLREALGDLMSDITFEGDIFGPSSISSTETPLFDVLGRAVRRAYPGADLLPMLAAGGTDGRFYRRRGVPAYGFGVLSERWDYGTFRQLFHGHNERVDLESIGLTVNALDYVVREFLGEGLGLRRD